MNATTVAVDPAKSVFQLAVADEHWRVVETQRLTRTQFERWFANRHVSLVIMEACGSAHHWGRWLNGLGIEVAVTSGDVSHFKDARHFSNWFGLTPKEYSSGNSRYLRMLLTHGARSVLYDCRRIPNSQTIGQFLALVGESIYEVLGLGVMNSPQGNASQSRQLFGDRLRIL